MTLPEILEKNITRPGILRRVSTLQIGAAPFLERSSLGAIGFQSGGAIIKAVYPIFYYYDCHRSLFVRLANEVEANHPDLTVTSNKRAKKKSGWVYF
jgi:hypothetical protein